MLFFHVLPVFYSHKTNNVILKPNHIWAVSDLNLSGGEVPLCDSQGGRLERNGRPEKLYHGEYLQWLQPGNIQGVYMCVLSCQIDPKTLCEGHY